MYGPCHSPSALSLTSTNEYTQAAFDELRLGTSYATVAPPSQTLSGIVVTPDAPILAESSTEQFIASGVDQLGNPMALPADLTWTVTSSDGSDPGTIDSSTGLYTAPSESDLFTVTVSSASTGINGQASVGVAAEAGPVGDWPLNDGTGFTASDLSGFDNAGTLVNGPIWTTNSDGVVGLSFNGTGQYVSIPDSPSLDPTSQITVGAWINATDWDGNNTILQKSVGTSNDQYQLGDQGGELTFDLAGIGSVSATLPSTGAWHYVAATYDGADIDLYVDGTMVTQEAASGSLAVTAGSLEIGDKPGSTSNSDSFNGTIENVSIYGTALSADQIAVNATAPTITSDASVTDSTLADTNTDVMVGAISANGLDNLTYTWSTVSAPTGATALTFSDNGDGTAQDATVTFDQAGTYVLEVTVADGPVSTTSEVSIDVVTMLSELDISPSSPTIATSGTEQFSAAAFDQFGNSMTLPSDLAWSVSGPEGSDPGSIDSSSGLYTAPSSDGGPFTITASSDLAAISSQATVNVADTAGSVGDWQFNEGGGATAFDNSGYNNDGTLVNSPVWSGAADGAVGLFFNGTGQYVDIPDNASLDPTSQITVGAYFNAAAWTNGSTLLQKSDSGSNDQYALGDNDGVLTFSLSGVGSVFATLPSTGV
jgi:hypothetical protein